MRIGRLYRKNEDDRWVVVFQVGPEFDYTTLTSGSRVEIKIGGKWIETSIEHNGRDYYATTPGILLVNNLEARF